MYVCVYVCMYVCVRARLCREMVCCLATLFILLINLVLIVFAILFCNLNSTLRFTSIQCYEIAISQRIGVRTG